MTLILNNQDVQSVLTMEITMAALERAYAVERIFLGALRGFARELPPWIAAPPR